MSNCSPIIYLLVKAVLLFTNNDHAGSDMSLIGLLRKREKEKGSRGRDVGMRDVGMGSRGTG